MMAVWYQTSDTTTTWPGPQWIRVNGTEGTTVATPVQFPLIIFLPPPPDPDIEALRKIEDEMKRVAEILAAIEREDRDEAPDWPGIIAENSPRQRQDVANRKPWRARAPPGLDEDR